MQKPVGDQRAEATKVLPTLAQAIGGVVGIRCGPNPWQFSTETLIADKWPVANAGLHCPAPARTIRPCLFVVHLGEKVATPFGCHIEQPP